MDLRERGGVRGETARSREKEGCVYDVLYQRRKNKKKKVDILIYIIHCNDFTICVKYHVRDLNIYH